MDCEDDQCRSRESDLFRRSPSPAVRSVVRKTKGWVDEELGQGHGSFIFPCWG